MKFKILLIAFILCLTSLSFSDTLGGRLPDYGENGGFVSPATENLDMDSYKIENVDTLNTGLGDNELYEMDQNLKTTNAVTHLSLDTGEGPNELFDMDQNVKTTNAVIFDTVDTGQGANELYDMNQNVLTTSTPTYEAINTGNGDCEVYPQDTFVFNVPISSATTNYLGSLQLPTKSFAHAILISSITFCCDSGTVTGLEAEWVSEATPFAAGTDILNGTINAGVSAKYGDSSGFADASIPSSSVLVIKSTGTTGTPTALWCRFEYQIVR